MVRIRLQLTCQDRHQCRFAGSVLAEQGKDPALFDFQADPSIGMHIAK
jgi:hypothetical protein